MNVFTIKVAGYNFEIKTHSDFSYRMCIPFITNEEPDFRIELLKKDIENTNGSKANLTEKQKDDIDSFLTLLRRIADILVDFDVLLIHGAAISVDERAYLFTGKSGTGKTTHIFRWLQNRPDLTIVNGDKPFIRFEDTPMVCGSPWCGKEGLFSNVMKPIKSVIMLERSENNSIRQVSFSEALPILLQSIYYSEDYEKKLKAIKLLKALDGKVNFYIYQMNNLKKDCFKIVYDTVHR